MFDGSRVDSSDPFAFADWAAASEPGLWRLGHLVTGDRDETARALEQALAMMYRQWPDLAGTAGLVALDIQARHELVRAVKGRRAPIRGARGIDVGTAAPTTGAETNGVWRTYEGLDLERRIAVALRYDERRDAVDIADVLDLDPETVEQLLTSFAVAAGSAVPDEDAGAASVESLLHDAFDAHVVSMSAGEAVGQRILTTVRLRRRRYGTAGTFAAIALVALMAWVASPSAQDWTTPGVLLAELDDMRWESYGGIEVQVPNSWGYGDLTQWCAPEGSPAHVDRPSVDRPGSGAMTRCSVAASTGGHGLDRPTSTAGLLLRPAGAGPRLAGGDVAMGTAILRRTVGGVDLTVVDVDADLAQRILSSAEVVLGRDRNGCAVRVEIPRLGRHATADSRGVDGMAGAVSATICHYETQPWGRPTLVFSERLAEPGAAEELRRRIRAARPLDVTAPPIRAAERAETAVVLVSLHGFGTADVWVHHAGCALHGTDDGHRPRALTADLLRPILDEPWRGQVATGCPGVGTDKP